MNKRLFWFFTLAFLLPFLGWPASTTTAAPLAVENADFAYFPETGRMVSAEAKKFFETHGGLATFGLPLTEVISDTETGLNVQYFERARFEFRSEGNSKTFICLTWLGTLLTWGSKEPAFQRLTASSDPQRTFFPEAGHTLGGAFKNTWETRGGLDLWGHPISEEFYEINNAEKATYLVQYFEKGKFIYHPKAIGTPKEVEFADLGRQLLERYPAAKEAMKAPPRMTLLGEATTFFANSPPERELNVVLGTTLLHGKIVPANAQFSFNNSGDFTARSGFVEGYGIVGNRLEKMIAGGLCQVSTTLFRAVANTGLKITERHGHTFALSFYENILGFDAAVQDPGLDLRWINDTSAPVYLLSSSNVPSATVTVQLWGFSNDRRMVKYDGPYISKRVEPGSPVWEYDASLPKGTTQQVAHRRAGMNVVYNRTVTLPSGQVLHRDSFKTKYNPLPDFYTYGPGVRPPR